MEARRDQDMVGATAGGPAVGGSAGGVRVDKRPGLITFAAIMMLVVGGFHILVALSEIVNSTWILNLTNDWIGASLLLWGLIDLGVAALALYAGIDILRGGSFGLVLGYVFAGLGILRWLVYLSATPVVGVVIIALDVLVIYGLAHHSDYFETV
jgi:hypothetical protein